MAKPKEIFVVVCEGEVMGIYPDDRPLAGRVLDNLLEARYKAEIAIYKPTEENA